MKFPVMNHSIIAFHQVPGDTYQNVDKNPFFIDSFLQFKVICIIISAV